MARIKKLIFVVLLSCFCNACSFNNKPPELQQESSNLMPSREESVNFFSRMHTLLRDTERSIDGFMYGVRDDVDSFIYDAQKDYYENYQK
jgi:hypothetical protein